ncbi:MAG TPA: MGMT family protein [Patescibacteria group bacterium]|nr:MGMT family protein [Patescibacteria group bacterium]
MKINSKVFAKNVYKIVNQIPRGRVMTYGQIAAIIGQPRCAQYVGWALHWADQKKVPYQRVLNRFGGLAAGYPDGGRDRHRFNLIEEGIKVRKDGTVDLKRYLWWPEKINFEVIADFLNKIDKIKK